MDMNGSSTEKIIEVVNLCPTDALTWKWNDDEKNESVDINHTNHINYRRPELRVPGIDVSEENPVSVKVMPDGPLIINGSFTLLYSGNKKEVHESIISLCRCGLSAHLPFCDGAHRKSEFNDN